MINFKLTKSKILLYFCLIFLVSIFLVSFWPTDWLKHDLVWFVGLVTCLALVGLVYLFLDAKPASLFYKFGLLSLAIVCLAGWRYSISIPSIDSTTLQFYNGQKLTVIGQVAEDPDVRPDQVKYLFQANYIKGLNKVVGGQLLFTAGLYPEFKYGDQLAVTCQLQAPKAINDFAYDRYLARSAIYSVCYQPQTKLLNSAAVTSQGNYGAILKFKDRLRDLMNQGLTEPEASLARGIMLGDQRGLPDEIKQQFARTGLSHIVAISGMNFSFIVILLASLLLACGLRRQQIFYLTSAVIFGYVILIGLPASAVRAVIMSFLFLLAIFLGRLGRLINALILAATLMTLLNPRLLRDDVGFQLSFLALLGIIYVYPLLNRWLKQLKYRPPQLLSETICLTLSAQVFTLPIMANSFQAVSLIAPISNLFILWTLPVLTVLLAGALPLAWIWPNLTLYFFLPAQFILKYILWSVHRFSDVSWAQLPMNQLSWLGTVVYYLFVSWFIFKFKYDKINLDDNSTQN